MTHSYMQYFVMFDVRPHLRHSGGMLVKAEGCNEKLFVRFVVLVLGCCDAECGIVI